MKILTFIFSVYLLGLSVFPCADTFYSAPQGQTVVLADQHQKGSHKTDQCTPFCICSCCHTSVTRLSSVFSPDPVFFNTDGLVGIVQNYISVPASPPFQPPKV